MEEPYKLPDSWVWCRLGDYLITKTGGTPSRGVKKYYNGDIFWLKSGELEDNIISRSEETITELGLKNSNAKIFPKGTLLIALYGATVGKTGKLDVNSATNQAICAIFNDNQLFDDDYLWKFLISFRNKLIQKSFGGAQPNISQGIIRDLLIPLPPLPEQHRIVDKLETLLTQMNASNERLTKVEPFIRRFHHSLLAVACLGKLTKDWRKENPDAEPVSELLEQIRQERAQKYGVECRKAKSERRRKPKKPINLKYAKQQEINPEESPELPESWLWVNLGEAVNDFQPGFACGARDDQGYIQLRMNNIGLNGSVVLDKTLKVPKERTNLEKYKLRDGDILLNNTNSVELIGKTVIFRDEIQNCVYSNHITRIRPENRLIYPEFLLYILMDNFNQGVFRMMCHRFVGQAGISRGKLLRLTIPLPPLSEQNMIIENVKYLFEFSNSIEQRVSKATNYTNQLVQSILAKAFRGELVPQDPNDKPASELLDRIKKERQKKASKEKLKYKRNNPTKLNDYL